MPPKRKKSENGSGPAKDCKSPEDIKAFILGVMLQYHMDNKDGASFADVANEVGVHKSNNKWSKTWTSLKNEGLIAPSTSGKGCQITPEGIAKGKTPEYEAFMRDKNFVAANNDEHQDRIKGRFKKKKSAAVFDLLMKHGFLSRQELAGLVRQKDRSHDFSYSLKELKGKGLIEAQKDGKHKKFRLSNKAFLKPEDRPVPEPIDPETLAEAVAWNANTKPKGVKNSAVDGDDDSTANDKDDERPCKKQKRGKKIKATEETNDDDDKSAVDNSEEADSESDTKKESKSTSSGKVKAEIAKAEASEAGVKGEEGIIKAETSVKIAKEEQEEQGIKSEVIKAEATKDAIKVDW